MLAAVGLHISFATAVPEYKWMEIINVRYYLKTPIECQSQVAKRNCKTFLVTVLHLFIINGKDKTFSCLLSFYSLDLFRIVKQT